VEYPVKIQEKELCLIYNMWQKNLTVITPVIFATICAMVVRPTWVASLFHTTLVTMEQWTIRALHVC
jgi:hypothetical protein